LVHVPRGSGVSSYVPPVPIWWRAWCVGGGLRACWLGVRFTQRALARVAQGRSAARGGGTLKVGWQHRTVASGPCCSFWRRRGALKVGALALVRLPLCGCVGGEAYLRVRPARLFKEFSPLPTWSPPGGGCAGCGGARVGIALSAGSRAPACPLSGAAVLALVRPGGVGVCSLGGCLLLFGCYASVCACAACGVVLVRGLARGAGLGARAHFRTRRCTRVGRLG